MRKLILTVMLLGLPLLAWSQKVQIAFYDSIPPCAGYAENSFAYVEITSDPPFRLPEGAGMTYTWYAVHEKGTKRWNTPLPYRPIHTPWSGEYQIWVVVEYINKFTLEAFKAYKSNRIDIVIESCGKQNEQ